MELGKESINDDDRAVLLEDGGGLQTASPRDRNFSTSSPILRCIRIVYMALKSLFIFQTWLMLLCDRNA